MHTLLSLMFTPEQLLSQLSKTGSPGTVGRWCLAYSGGMDSTVLLHTMAQLKAQHKLPEPIIAIHIHHGLSPNADAWQRHCEQTCATLGIPLTCIRVAVNSTGHGLEQAAREARYTAFDEVLQEGDALLMGHHLDDQAETLLLRLLRGSGPRGLAAMAPERKLARGMVCRPLLGTPRQALLDYAQNQQLSWIEDESNTDERYDRNYLRHQVLPLLLERWPDALTRLGQAAQLCGESEQLLNLEAAKDFAMLEACQVIMGVGLNWEQLKAFNNIRRNNLIRYWLRSEGFSVPGQVHLAEIEKQFFRGEDNWSPAPECAVQWGNVILRVSDGRLVALWRKLMWSPNKAEAVIDWLNPAKPIALPAGDTLQWVKSSVPGVGLAACWMQHKSLQVKWRLGGERCQPAGKAHSQQLKKLLQQWRVPLWLRARIPVIYIEGEIIAIGSYCVNQAFSAPSDQLGFTCQWQFPEP